MRQKKEQLKSLKKNRSHSHRVGVVPSSDTSRGTITEHSMDSVPSTKVVRSTRAVRRACIQVLLEKFPNQVVRSKQDLQAHAHDWSWHPHHAPDAVVYPGSTEDVSSIVKICARYAMPIVPFGCGTSLEGHVQAIEGGVCVDMSRMNKIIAVHEVDQLVEVEAGVTYLQLKEYLKDQAYHFPIGPEIEASLGGFAANGASGTHAVRYGTMRDNVQSLQGDAGWGYHGNRNLE